jgi:hypothetical protein
MIGFRISRPSIAGPSKQVMIRAWKRADWPLFNNTIRSRKLDFSGLLNKQDTIAAIELLTSTINEALNIAVPTAPSENKIRRMVVCESGMVIHKSKTSKKALSTGAFS